MCDVRRGGHWATEELCMKPRRVALLRCLVAPFACTAIFAPACVSTAAGAAMAAASAGTGAAATRPVNYQARE